MWFKSLLALLHAVWLGAHFAVGYVVTPLLFAYADDGLFSRQTAGNLAGDLFDVVVYVGLFMASVWWWCLRRERMKTRLIASIMILLALTQWVITPVIVAIKQQQSHWLWNLLGGSFGMWHGISSLFYLSISVLLLVFTWQHLKAKTNRYSVI